MILRILVRGGGDLASGVILRLHRAGWHVLVTELPHPLAVRRNVSFAQAVYSGEIEVEDVIGKRVADLPGAEAAWQDGCVPVLVDPDLQACAGFHPHVLVDARMRKSPPESSLPDTVLVIGLGPGFHAGVDCHAVIETNRGPRLGRVIWTGQAQADTGIPEQVGEHRGDRVLRAPVDGPLEPAAEIGALLHKDDLIAQVSGQAVRAPFDGVLRGLAHAGLVVHAGDKIGDLDPRGDPRLSRMVSEKALAIGGGVLEAILSWRPLRGWR